MGTTSAGSMGAHQVTETDHLYKKTLEVHGRLGKVYGMPEWQPDRRPRPLS